MNEKKRSVVAVRVTLWREELVSWGVWISEGVYQQAATADDYSILSSVFGFIFGA